MTATQHKLRFDAFTEALFQTEYRDSTRDVSRIAVLTGIVIYTFLAFIDPLTMPRSYGTIHWIRLGIICPLMSIPLVISYLPSARMQTQLLVSIASAVSGIGVSLFLWFSHPDEPGNQHYYTGIILIYLFISSFIRLPTLYVALTVVLIQGVYIASTAIVQSTYLTYLARPGAIGTLLVQWVFTSIASVICILIAYLLERATRQAFLDKRTIAMERARSESLLLSILPPKVAEKLKNGQESIVEHFESCTILFADIVGFTPLVSEMRPEQTVKMLDELFSKIDEIVSHHGAEKIKTIGDCYMVASGVPTRTPDHAQRMARIALEIQALSRTHVFSHGRKLDLRIGMHSGPIVAGIIGKKKFIYDVWGDTVNTASRMESHSVSGQIQVTEACATLLQEEFQCSEVGVIQVKGKGAIRVFRLEGILPNVDAAAA